MTDLRSTRVLAIATALAGALAFAHGATAGPDVPLPKPTSLFSGKMKLFFAPDAGKTPQSLRGSLAALVRSAHETVHVAMFEIDDEDFVEALLDRHRHGVKVRCVIDKDNLKDANAPLQKEGILVPDERTALMHSKLVVVDHRRVFGGSVNAAEAGISEQDNDAFIVTSSALASRAERFVEDMFDRKLWGPKRKPQSADVPEVDLGQAKVSLSFSPEDKPHARVVAELKAAKKSITFLAFNLSHPDVLAALEEAAKNHVAVKGVIDRTNASFGGASLAKKGCAVKIAGNTKAFMHAKFFVIDAEIPEKACVVSGSFNFSANATENDEDLWVIRSADAAKAWLRGYAHVESTAAPVTDGLTGAVHHDPH